MRISIIIFCVVFIVALIMKVTNVEKENIELKRQNQILSKEAVKTCLKIIKNNPPTE